ncbi:hypothetical protein [Cytobacillus firmus]|uniref:Uncharacterized protein n=1 Tax=Cytobacillus firmus DS1 TaxID=1307436 RepID=W7L2V1_CYTFI|nr:hypothetical protein [Cytobacillus firmus]EWG12733.1 hypothetical protein PBF_04320 [Cytobacillus firmus DS1]
MVGKPYPEESTYRWVFVSIKLIYFRNTKINEGRKTALTVSLDDGEREEKYLDLKKPYPHHIPPFLNILTKQTSFYTVH